MLMMLAVEALLAGVLLAVQALAGLTPTAPWTEWR